MKKLLFAVMLLTLSSLALSQQVVIIEANKGWQNSGISISAGENLLFFARGAWASNFDDRPLNWWGPSGRGTAGVGAPLAMPPWETIAGTYMFLFLNHSIFQSLRLMPLTAGKILASISLPETQ